MVQKRQLAEEEYDVSPKHLKLENSYQLVSSLEFPSKDLPNSVIAEGHFSVQNYESDKITGLPVCIEKEIVLEHTPQKPRTLIQPEDTYSRLLHFPPVKQVPIGPEFQAEIPEWCGFEQKNDENRFIGSCVIQMPESDLTSFNLAGRGRSLCCCEDPGSVGCVRLHIREARENLKGNIGHDRFSELGFGNMGDVVACKWTEEDERLFHEVVYSNPASLGQNFWNHLADAFPSRTNQEIVSYYFNVFVLQRRAEQNRSESMNADSDDDEWQGSDSSEDDDLCGDENREFDFVTGNRVFDYYEDDSCTSSDTCIEQQVNHDFIFENSDSKVWDLGFFSFPSNKVDFLPTGSMIEEVFGDGSWNSESDKGSN